MTDPLQPTTVNGVPIAHGPGVTLFHDPDPLRLGAPMPSCPACGRPANHGAIAGCPSSLEPKSPLSALDYEMAVRHTMQAKIDALTAELAKVKAELAEAVGNAEAADVGLARRDSYIKELEQGLSLATRQREEMRADLSRFGRHSDGCDQYRIGCCTCGLSAALANNKATT